MEAVVACVSHKELQHRQTEKVCDVLYELYHRYSVDQAYGYGYQGQVCVVAEVAREASGGD